MSKPRAIMWLAIAALAGVAFYIAKDRLDPAALPPHGGAPAQTVAAQTAQMQSWQPTMELVGELVASEGADLSLQVSGIVETLSFESGQTVRAGTELLQLVAEDQIAKLASLKATAELNAIILKRDIEQLKIKAVSQATVDTDEANLKNSQALVKQQEALVSYYTLKAPFAGRLGIRNVDLGEYLSAGTAVVTLQALDPLFADFFVPQKFFGNLKVGEAVKVTVDAYPSQSFAGTVSAINSKVESGSRNVKVRATLPNPDSKLVPGMFARVSLDVGAAERFVTLPQTAIVANPYGSTVFVLEKTSDGNGLVARETFVKLGEARGDFVSVVSGLTEGETVVVAGQIKLRNGTPAVIDNSHLPKVELNPTVTD